MDNQEKLSQESPKRERIRSRLRSVKRPLVTAPKTSRN
jgi:hypothetical protein